MALIGLRYKKAYESMKACPLSFQHPSEAQQLNGLGPKLCDRLTEKLKAYCLENGLPEPEHPQKRWFTVLVEPPRHLHSDIVQSLAKEIPEKLQKKRTLSRRRGRERRNLMCRHCGRVHMR